MPKLLVELDLFCWSICFFKSNQVKIIWTQTEIKMHNWLINSRHAMTENNNWTTYRYYQHTTQHKIWLQNVYKLQLKANFNDVLHDNYSEQINFLNSRRVVIITFGYLGSVAIRIGLLSDPYPIICHDFWSKLTTSDFAIKY